MKGMNLQGGDNDISINFYKQIFSFIQDNDNVLNLGSGVKFNFERELYSEKKANITSGDIVSPRVIPPFIGRFINQSVEEEFFLDTQYDIVSFFELIEHIDKTDILLRNCFNNLKNGGYLIFSFPNLASIYSRLELLFGYQPHILEVSNENANFGTGIWGRYNNPYNKPLHHIRGISHCAMKEMVGYHGFEVVKIIGYEHRIGKIFKHCPRLAPVNIFICKKHRSDG